MGQIVSAAAKPKRCNLNKLSQLGTPAAGEYILVSSDNSMNAVGQGNFDCYIEGDGTTAATALELKNITTLQELRFDNKYVSIGLKSSNIVSGKQAKGNVGDTISFANWPAMSYYRFDNQQTFERYVITGESGTQAASSLIQFVNSSNVITRRLEVSTPINTIYTDDISFESGEVACYITYLTAYGLAISGYNVVTLADINFEDITTIKNEVAELDSIIKGDAKVDITNLFTWTEGGYINSSGGKSSSTIQKYSDYVDVSTFGDSFFVTLEIVSASNASQRYVFYDSNKAVIEANSFPLGASAGSILTKVSIPSNAKYFRTSFWIDEATRGAFSAKRILHSNLEPLQKSSEEFNSIMATDGSIDISRAFVFSAGLVRWSDGGTVTSSVNSASDFVDIRGYKSIELTVDATSASDRSQGLAFYDENKAYITGYKCPYADTSTYKIETYIIPDGAVYCRTTYWTDISNKGNQPFFCKAINTFVSSIYDKINSQKSLDIPNYGVEPMVGSPSIYISQSTAEEGNLNSKLVADIYARYDAMVTNFPDYMERKSDLCTITSGGNTWQVRIYRFGFNKLIVRNEEGSNNTTYTNLYDDGWQNKRTILITCGVHGNEKTPWWGTMLAFEELLSSNAEWAKYIKANFYFYIIPCVNPYGLDNNSRYNENNKDLNRAAGANETSRVALRTWIKNIKNSLYYWIDVHGSQGRWAYVPCNPIMPSYHQVQQATFKMVEALHSAFGEIWTGVSSTFADYSPYLFFEQGGWISGGMSSEAYALTGINECALETPDSLSSGNIGTNEGVGCAITKMLLWNMVQMLGSITLTTLPFNCIISGTTTATGTLVFTDNNTGTLYNAEITNGSFSITLPNGLYSVTCTGVTFTNGDVVADQDKVVNLVSE